MSKTTQPKPTVIDFLSRELVKTGRCIEEISKCIGQDRPDLLKGILAGKIKLPAKLVYPISKALDIDPAHLMQIFLQDYCPEIETAILDCGGGAVVTARERTLLEAYRQCTDDVDPEVLILEGKQVVALALS